MVVLSMVGSNANFFPQCFDTLARTLANHEPAFLGILGIYEVHNVVASRTGNLFQRIPERQAKQGFAFSAAARHFI